MQCNLSVSMNPGAGSAIAIYSWYWEGSFGPSSTCKANSAI